MSSPAPGSCAPSICSVCSPIWSRRICRAERRPMSAAEIGAKALGRSPKFDPAQDPVVRVECTRLRRLLDIYYQGEGRNDPLRFILPRGSYRIVIVPCGPVASDPAEPEGPHEIASQPDDAKSAVAPAITPAQGRDRTQFGRVRRLYGAIAMMLFVIVLVGSVTLVPTFDRSSHLSRRAGPSTATIVPGRQCLTLECCRACACSPSGMRPMTPCCPDGEPCRGRAARCAGALRSDRGSRQSGRWCH